MQTAPFDYHRPASVAEALDLLGRLEGARPIAGGHSLLPAMKLRVANPPALVDLTRIPGMGDISNNGDGITIGALATHAAVVGSDAVRRHCPVLAETAEMIGDRQVRNRGTMGGAVAHADPAADYPTVLKALDASITVTGGGGDRTVSAGDFFVDIFTTALQPGELVTAVTVPALGAGWGGAYHKHRHPASSYAVVGVAAVVQVADGVCRDARIAVGGVTGKPELAVAAADALTGQAPGAEAIAAAAGRVAEALANPIGDTYASGEYRAHLAGVLTGRALTDAFERAGG